jgi:mannose-6-phosphate isomerase-like protein (cupin superfamily)
MAETRIVKSGDGETYGGDAFRFKQGSLTGGRFDFTVANVPYLIGPPLHIHRDQDDTFFVLEGVLTLQIGDELVELMPGDFASVPPGVPHTFDNIRKDQTVKIVNLMTPGGLDALFQDLPMIRAAMQDKASAEALWERHGVRMVGPSLRDRLGLT